MRVVYFHLLFISILFWGCNQTQNNLDNKKIFYMHSNCEKRLDEWHSVIENSNRCYSIYVLFNDSIKPNKFILYLDLMLGEQYNYSGIIYSGSFKYEKNKVLLFNETIPDTLIGLIQNDTLMVFDEAPFFLKDKEFKISTNGNTKYKDKKDFMWTFFDFTLKEKIEKINSPNYNIQSKYSINSNISGDYSFSSSIAYKKSSLKDSTKKLMHLIFKENQFELLYETLILSKGTFIINHDLILMTELRSNYHFVLKKLNETTLKIILFHPYFNEIKLFKYAGVWTSQDEHSEINIENYNDSILIKL